jgi:hypothetical protein
MGAIAAAWLARIDPARGWKWWPPFPSGPAWRSRSRSITVACLTAVLLVSNGFAVSNLIDEYRKSYSGAQEMVAYIKSHRLEHLKIAVYRDGWGSSLAPYMPWTRFYYPGAQRYGTFIIQDPTHRRGDVIPWGLAMQRAFIEFDSAPRFLLLTNIKLNIASIGTHFKLLYEVAQPGIISDEEYFLYECYPRGGPIP